jgi:hypothetical protein
MMEMAVAVATSEFILSLVVHKLKSSSFFPAMPRNFLEKKGAEVDLNFQTESVDETPNFKTGCNTFTCLGKVQSICSIFRMVDDEHGGSWVVVCGWDFFK